MGFAERLQILLGVANNLLARTYRHRREVQSPHAWLPT